VTDADLVAGYLDPLNFCAGNRRLDVAQARGALTSLAGPLTMTPEQVALGIIHVAVTRMTGAIRTITTQAGHDPRDCALVAFGGAGPLHAAMVARELGIPELLIPAEPALLSARGLLMADYRADAYRTLSADLASVDPQLVSRTLAELDADARNQLGEAVVTNGELESVYTLELCYEGQQDLVPVTLGHPLFEEQDKQAVADDLDAEFQNRYGFLPPARVARLVRLRVTATGALPRPPLGAAASNAAVSRQVGVRPVFIEDAASPVDAEIHSRTQLAQGTVVAGPCVIEECYSSTLVLPGQLAGVDELGNLRVTERDA
jgi:N-methylhydantoinase A